MALNFFPVLQSSQSGSQHPDTTTESYCDRDEQSPGKAIKQRRRCAISLNPYNTAKSDSGNLSMQGISNSSIPYKPSTKQANPALASLRNKGGALQTSGENSINKLKFGLSSKQIAQSLINFTYKTGRQDVARLGIAAIALYGLGCINSAYEKKLYLQSVSSSLSTMAPGTSPEKCQRRLNFLLTEAGRSDAHAVLLKNAIHEEQVYQQVTHCRPRPEPKLQTVSLPTRPAQQPRLSFKDSAPLHQD